MTTAYLTKADILRKDILEAIDRIQRYVGAMSLSEFIANPTLSATSQWRRHGLS